jgi:hypothetical protein
MRPIKKSIIVCSLFLTILLSGCKYFADPFLPDVFFVVDRINSGASEIDYEKVLMRHYNKLSEKEKEIFNKYLYFEFRINRKKAYVKASAE